MTEPRASRTPSGVIVPIVTPLDEDYCIDEEALRRLIRRCLEGGVDGIFAGGSAGVGPLLTDDQWRELMRIARDEVGPEHLLLGGVIATSTARALRQIAILDELGFEAMAVTPPYYVPLNTEEEFLDYFGACREATGMQMLAYNIPGFTGSNIPLPALRRMVEMGWITAIKESSGNREYFAEAVELCRDSQTAVMEGQEPHMAWGLTLGAVGVVPVCANYEPQTFVQIVTAAREGDTRVLEKAQARADLVRDTLSVATPAWLAGIVYAMGTLGFGTGRPIPPLGPLGAAQKLRIDRFRPLQPSPVSVSPRVDTLKD